MSNYYDGDDTLLKGATDETQIGNEADRLRVTTNIHPVPARSVIYSERKLMNGSSAEMAVNGSSTAQNFSFTPAGGEVWYFEAISLLIIDTGVTDFDEFGSLGSQLTNGLQLLVRSGGTEYEVGNFRNNAELSLCFAEHGYTPDSTSAWLDENDMFMGMKTWRVPMTLDGDQGDYIRLRVRDNLTGLNTLRSTVRVWREI